MENLEIKRKIELYKKKYADETDILDAFLEKLAFLEKNASFIKKYDVARTTSFCTQKQARVPIYAINVHECDNFTFPENFPENFFYNMNFMCSPEVKVKNQKEVLEITKSSGRLWWTRTNYKI